MSTATKRDLEQLEEAARVVARAVGPAFDSVGAGFAVLGFTFGEGGWSTYVSNSERDCMVKALRETADHLEANLDMPPIGPDEPEA